MEDPIWEDLTRPIRRDALADGWRWPSCPPPARPGADPHRLRRFTDIDGHRFTCFATDTNHGQLADLELRHRRRARCEDRIRAAKDTGLRNLPLHIAKHQG